MDRIAEVRDRLSIQEAALLSEVMEIFEKQFYEAVIAKVVDSDSEEYFDIEIQYPDGETESMAFLREMLTNGSTAKEIVDAIA